MNPYNYPQQGPGQGQGGGYNQQGYGWDVPDQGGYPGYGYAAPGQQGPPGQQGYGGGPGAGGYDQGGYGGNQFNGFGGGPNYGMGAHSPSSLGMPSPVAHQQVSGGGIQQQGFAQQGYGGHGQPGGPGVPQGYGGQQGYPGGPQGYGAQPPYGQGPPHGQYGGPPQGQMGYQAGPGQPQSAAAPQSFQPPKPRPSIVDFPNFDSQRDCEMIRKAKKQFPSDGKTICEIVIGRSNKQRQQLKKTYKTMFGKKLEEDLEDALRGDTEDLILAMMKSPAELDAKELHDAIDGLGTDETMLIDILCTASNQHIEDIKAKYQQMHKRDLEKDVKDDTSYCFKKILLSMLAGGRDESPNVNMERVKEDAQTLYQAGAARMGTDEERFNMILALRSYPHLRAVFKEYQRVAGKDLQRSIKDEFSGDIKNALLAIVKVSESPPKFFAEVLHDTMEGLGTDEMRLIHTMAARSEIDLEDIKDEFQRMYGKPLAQWIVEDTSGKFKRALLMVVNGNVHSK